MRSRRPGLPEVLAISLAGAVTTWLATLSWRSFTRDPGGYLGPLLVLALVVALTGALLRRGHVPGPVVLLGQLVTGAVATSLVLTGNPVPLGAGWVALVDQVQVALANAQAYRAPVPAEGSIDALLVLGGWACLVLVDLFAGTMRRAPLAGLPLLAIYSIPISMLGNAVAWWVFALTASGFMLMLYLQHGETVARWGRQLDGRRRGLDGQSATSRVGAGSVGVAATALAVVAPVLVPTLSLGIFDFGPGTGAGSDISVENPMTDLRRDLLETEDLPALRIVTDDPDPSYLRVAVLNRFGDNEWSTGDRDIPVDQQADGRIPRPELDRDVGQTEYDYELTATDGFRSRWLPAEANTTQISAPGDWRYDLETLDFLAAEDDLDTAGLSWTFSALDLDLDARTLADSPSSAGEVDSSYRDLPGDLPDLVENLAIEVTRDFPSRYEKAVALQDWFRTEGGFTYSTDQVETGNGTDELTAFLTEGDGGRVGYCEQFASAMAAMARSLGIPSRVAVGFLKPRNVSGQTWEYSSGDMHAWPELYFTGAGWVRFEPTPADRAQAVPGYTTQDLPQQPEVEPSDGPSQSQGPQEPIDPQRQPDQGQQPDAGDADAEAGFPWTTVLGSGGAVLAVLALLALPGVVRRRQTARRLDGSPEPAWAELEATALDLGVPWPRGRSPRQTRDRIVERLGSTHPDDADPRPRRGADVSPEGVAALDRLVLALERLRYSRGQEQGAGQAVVDDTRTVLAALRAGADERARRRARWWPASVLPWRRRDLPVVEEPVVVRRGSVVDHVG